MLYRIRFLEEQYEALLAFLFQDTSKERAAYLFTRTSTGPHTTTLLVREFWDVKDDDVVAAGPDHVHVLSRSYVRALQYADAKRLGFVVVHSHPESAPMFSPIDDREERYLFSTAYIRAPGGIGCNVHGSLVFAEEQRFAGRVWLPSGSSAPISSLVVLGRSFRVFLPGEFEDFLQAEMFDRQVKAFGPKIQACLRKLRIGVVGLGGIGSAVAEQLARLGVGHLLLIDPDTFERSNVNRVYGSFTGDTGEAKVEIAERNIRRTGVGTHVELLRGTIAHQRIARGLLDCDFVFACTDDHAGREILSQLAVWHYLPIFDSAVEITSSRGVIWNVSGRVTTLFPGAPCLVTRGRVSQAHAQAECVRLVDPAEYEHLRKEGYVPELETDAPAVVPFTTLTASWAVTEFLHRLTAFMGRERESTEVLIRFDDSEIRRNALRPSPRCFCGTKDRWGRGDRRDFLDSVWPD